MKAYLIQFENDTYPTLRVAARDEAHAAEKAAKNNKYGENFTITEAGKPDLEIAKEAAEAEAIKYGCAFPKLK